MKIRLVLFVVCLVGIATSAQGQGSLVGDYEVLKALYRATDGGDWRNDSGWDTTLTDSEITPTRIADFFGVDIQNERVAALTLLDNNLTGSIPPALGNLSNLTILDLRVNALTGSIPPALGNLSNLTILDLRVNALTGSIPPALGNLSNLTHLILGGNTLTGAIPPALGNLSNLTHLILWTNTLTGAIPPALGNLSNLTILDLSFNAVSGAIPSELGDLSSLTHLILWTNALTGSIPPQLGNLSNLTYLYLSDNTLMGSIPPELGNLSNLTYLGLSDNTLTGSIPPELGNLSNLTHLTLGGNALTGNVPPELGDLVAMKTLHLYSNQLEGQLPRSFLQMPNVSWLTWQANAGLCAPADTEFQTWLNGIAQRYFILGPNCSITATETEPAIPTTLTLQGVFPNPFSDHTRVTFDLPAAARVLITVFDLAGRAVYKSPVVHHAAGYGLQVRLDPELPSGTYPYRLTAEMEGRQTETDTGVMIRVR